MTPVNWGILFIVEDNTIVDMQMYPFYDVSEREVECISRRLHMKPGNRGRLFRAWDNPRIRSWSVIGDDEYLRYMDSLNPRLP